MKKIIFGIGTFLSFFTLFAQSIPVYAAKSAQLTLQERAILKQSLDVLGIMVRNLQAQAATASPANREKISMALNSISLSLTQIYGTLAALAPESRIALQKPAESKPVAIKQAPAVAPHPQTSPEPSAPAGAGANANPFAAAAPQVNSPNENVPVAAEAVPASNEAPANALASTGATLDPRNIWWPSLAIAALGIALYLYLQKRDAEKGLQSEANPIITA